MMSRMVPTTGKHLASARSATGYRVGLRPAWKSGRGRPFVTDRPWAYPSFGADQSKSIGSAMEVSQ